MIGSSGVVIPVKNYILSLGEVGWGRGTSPPTCRVRQAGIDLGFKPVKYRVAGLASMWFREENYTVNVHQSGNPGDFSPEL